MNENGFSQLKITRPPINLLANQPPILSTKNNNNININNNNNNNNSLINIENSINKCCSKFNNYNKRLKYRKRINKEIKELRDSLLNFIDHMNEEFENQKCKFQTIKDNINNYIVNSIKYYNDDDDDDDDDDEDDGGIDEKEDNDKKEINYYSNIQGNSQNNRESGSRDQFILELWNEEFEEKLGFFKPLYDYIYQQTLDISQSYYELKLKTIEFQYFPKNKRLSSTSTSSKNLFLLPLSKLYFKIKYYLKFISNRSLFYINSLKHNLPTIKIQINFK
ncbi:hypothetical protein RB653_002289 [Dictyostelium firmibasis]|uniref:Uncharacterized protein n=1 Tax=Dictyostelium firmibasis TaxID=79012 RepID=A0AAN7TX68_9MYCE